MSIRKPLVTALAPLLAASCAPAAVRPTPEDGGKSVTREETWVSVEVTVLDDVSDRPPVLGRDVEVDSISLTPDQVRLRVGESVSLAEIRIRAFGKDGRLLAEGSLIGPNGLLQGYAMDSPSAQLTADFGIRGEAPGEAELLVHGVRRGQRNPPEPGPAARIRVIVEP